MYQSVKLRPDQEVWWMEDKLHKAAVFQRFYSTYTARILPSKLLKGFGDFKTWRQVILTVKYADDLVLLATEETVLQSMINALTEPGRCYGPEMNVDETKVMSFTFVIPMCFYQPI